MIDCICKGNIYFFFLENFQEIRKLLFPLCFLNPLWKWDYRGVSFNLLLLFFLTAFLRLLSLHLLFCFCSPLCIVLSIISSSCFLLFLINVLFLLCFAVTHFPATPQLDCHTVLWIFLSVTREYILVLVLQGQGQLPNLCFQVLQGSIGVSIPHELQHFLLKRLGPLLTLIFISLFSLLLLLLEPWWMIPLLEILPLSLAL